MHAPPFSIRVVAVGLAVLVALPVASWAATSTFTVQGSPANSDDAYLREDNDSEKNGTKPELRLKATDDRHNRNLVLKMPMPSIGARTVVQAYLRLTVSGAGSATPIDARVYPLLESWSELWVTWAERSDNVAWSTPGGTRAPIWSGRALPASAHTGQQVSWAVGPIVSRWQRGAMALHGFVIEADRGVPDREVIFRSSEYLTVPAAAPQLVVHATDEPPAIVEGSAEIQPRAIRAGSTDAAIDLWMAVQASGATPSGSATGFDTAILNHGGQIAGTGVDGIWVNGNPVPAGQMSWYDNGSSITVSFPRVTGTARVRISFGARLLTAATSGTIEMPVLVDDATTPGAWPQSLWAGDGDGIAGNGDDWLITITNLPPVAVDLKPDTATVSARLAVALQTYGRDASGNVFTVAPDSIQVVPPSGGVVKNSVFTAGNNPGLVRLIAWLSGLRDTSLVTVVPARLPTVSQIVLRNEAGAATTVMTPLDSMRLDVTVADGDGFKDVTGFDVVFHDTGHEQDLGQPAFRAEYRWRRNPAVNWSLVDPTGTSWAVVPGLSSVDTLTQAATPQTVRLGFVPGRIARASSTGRWAARVLIYSATPADTAEFALGNLDVASLVTMTVADTGGAFNAGRAGDLHLPLNVPPDGALHVSVVANTTWALDGGATHMAGDSSATDTLFVGPPTPRVAWALASSGVGGGWLDSTLAAMLPAEAALEIEQAATRHLHLWLDHPSVPAQGYRGSVRLRARDAATAAAPVATVPLTATVVATGGAASAALGEVAPEQVQAGAPAATFDAWLYPSFQGGDTGINRLLVNLPPGYGTPLVTDVRVAGLPVTASDASTPALLRVNLATRVTTASLVHVRFNVGVPAVLDSAGSSFTLQYDDAATPLAAQSATEGDANGAADGDDWTVAVVAGPVAALAIGPDPAVCYLDSTVAFIAAATDGHGHPTSAVVVWSVLDGVGTIGASSGVFTGTVSGTGRVVAQSGSVRDTVAVTVRPVRALAVREVQTPAGAYQGQGALVVRVRVENVGAEDATVDSLQVRFRRTSGASADVDFILASAPELPLDLAAGESVWLETGWQVGNDAVTGRITADARAAALAGEVRFADDGADLMAGFDLVIGGVIMTASQSPASVRPRTEASVLGVALQNLYPVSRRLQGLALTNATSGPGDADQRDAELGEVRLYRDNGNAVFEPGTDALLVETIAVGGGVQIIPLNLVLSPGEAARLFVTARPPLEARDGDVLDLALTGPAAVSFDSTTIVRNGWPLDPAGGFAVDGMVAAQMALTTSGLGSALTGAVDQVALSVSLPPNGYTGDVLERLAIANLGTARAGVDVTRLRVWADDGDGSFSSSGDRLLGTMVWTGSRWEISGLAEPVPSTRLLVHFTVDMDVLAENGRTIRLVIPAGPFPGIGMASGNSGPLDVGVESPHTMIVTSSDRLAFGTGNVAPATVAPGMRGVMLLHLTASNTYPDPRRVIAIAITNTSRGAGSVADRDRVIERLELRIDADDDGVLDDPATDPVVGVGAFADGRLAFGGLTWDIPARATRSMFVTGDVSLRDAADGDSLSVGLALASDVSVQEPTSVFAAWPVEGGRSHVDGMVAAQLTMRAVPGVTLAPGDGPMPALDLIVPRNGRTDDLLAGVKIVNLGSATPSDLPDLHLWRDGGDGQLDAGASDDLDLGTMVQVAGGWQSALLAQPLPALGARLFVTVTVSSAPTDSATLRLAVPVHGITVASDNDGPRDVPVANPEALILSTAPLLASLSTSPQSSTIGQVIQVTMVVRNVGGEAVTGIVPDDPIVSGTAMLTRLTGQVPDSLGLAPAGVDTFTWTYRADAAGDARFIAGVAGSGFPSGLTRRSVAASSDLHHVYTSVGVVDMLPVHSMPGTARAGQRDVVPFSLTFRNPGGGEASNALVERLRVRLEDQTGAGIVPADLVKRVVVNEGVNVYLVKSAIENTGSDLMLQLATPVTVTAQEPVTVSVRFDLRDTTMVSTFRAVITDAGAVEARDATSGGPVAVGMPDPYPLRSGLARVVAEATVLEVATGSGAPVRVTRGTAGVPVMSLSLHSPGITGISSDVRVHALRLVFEDVAGAPLPRPDLRLTRLVLRSGAQTVADRALGIADSAGALVWLNPPLSVPANTTVPVAVTADVAPSAPPGSLRLRLDAPATMDARDAHTGAAVPASYALPPLQGTPVAIEARAETLFARGTRRFPPGIPVGRTGVLALEVTLRHPHLPGTARIRVDSLRVRCRDEARNALSPGAYLSAVHLRWNGVPAASMTSVPSGTGGVMLALAAPPLEPRDTARVEIIVDVSPAAPATFLELEVTAPGLVAVDANMGAPVRVEPEPGIELPLVSGLTRLLPAARDLSVALDGAMPAVLTGDGREVRAGTLRLTNDAPEGAGSITIDRIVLSGADQGFLAVALGRAVTAVAAWHEGTLWAWSTLGPDSVTAALVPAAPLDVVPGTPVDLDLRFVTSTGPTVGALRLGCDATGIGVVQPAGGALTINVRPEGGQAFPLWTEAGHFSEASLAGSWSNFPNPFVPAREPTTFSYWLRAPATVTLRLWTLRNEIVRTLVGGEARTAGLHQTDRWDGRNGAGDLVRNGAYMAEISVRYDDGASERLLRKVAVVR